jgi:soluble lytic murein transglycosylase
LTISLRSMASMASLGFVIAAASFSAAAAQTLPDVLTPSDEAAYRAAFTAAEAGDVAAVTQAQESISETLLLPVLARALTPAPAATEPAQGQAKMMSGAAALSALAPSLRPVAVPVPMASVDASSMPAPQRRSMGQMREPVFDPDPGPASRTEADEDRIQAMADQFYAGNDGDALARAQILINGPLTGQAGWIGGLAAWRSGDIATARSFFTAAANWEYGDDWTRAAGAYWAARAAGRLGDNAGRTALLEQAAASPLTFYGQLALESLGRWGNLPMPSEQDRAASQIRLTSQDQGVRRAIALSEIGRRDDASVELSLSWSQSMAGDDLAYLSIAQQLDLAPVVERIEDVSPAASVAALYPVPQNLTPQGGWVLDRALVFAVMRQESKFDPRAVSRSGARGLMQLMPATAAWMTDRPELRRNPALLYDVSLNVALGERYLEQTMEMGAISNCLIRTIMAYNAGPGNVTRWSGSVRGGDDPLLFMEAIPSGQARVYTERVLSNVWIYHARLGQAAPSLQRLARGMSPLYEPQDNPRTASAGGSGAVLSARRQ